MTYWATLWYAGHVVMTMGFEGMTHDDCELLTSAMIRDINASHVVNKTELEKLGSTDARLWVATCETERLDTEKITPENIDGVGN
jgi:hypothetical protein